MVRKSKTISDLLIMCSFDLLTQQQLALDILTYLAMDPNHVNRI